MYIDINHTYPYFHAYIYVNTYMYTKKARLNTRAHTLNADRLRKITFGMCVFFSVNFFPHVICTTFFYMSTHTHTVDGLEFF